MLLERCTIQRVRQSMWGITKTPHRHQVQYRIGCEIIDTETLSVTKRVVLNRMRLLPPLRRLWTLRTELPSAFLELLVQNIRERGGSQGLIPSLRLAGPFALKNATSAVVYND